MIVVSRNEIEMLGLVLGCLWVEMILLLYSSKLSIGAFMIEGIVMVFLVVVVLVSMKILVLIIVLILRLMRFYGLSSCLSLCVGCLEFLIN